MHMMLTKGLCPVSRDPIQNFISALVKVAGWISHLIFFFWASNF